MYKSHAWSSLWITAFLIAGCKGGSGEGLDVNGRPIGENPGGGPLVATFGSIQANVFTPNCAVSGCHVGAAAPQGLRLDAANSYAALVNTPANEVSSLDRVEPGDPDASYVIQKLEGTAAEGDRMPFGGPYLSQDTIDVIRQWISDGAPPDPVAPDEPPTVTSTTPADGAVLDAFPGTVTILFSSEMDASLVSEASVLLSASGGDGSFGDGNEVAITPASVALDDDNPRRAVMDLTGVASEADVYELRLTASAPVAIADVNGNALDGDGDGEAGGDFVSTFVVTDVQPTLESIQENVFTPICSGCHSGPPGPTLPSGQDLSSTQASYDSLVDVPSIGTPSVLRVEPGNADDSYLVQKLEGTAPDDRMPQGGPPLSAATIAAIRAWIDAGAPFAGGSEDVTPPTVSLDALADPVSGTVDLSADASDDVGVTSVDFLVDDALIATDIEAPYGVDWDTTEVADGEHALTARAHDAAGNVATSDAVSVNVVNDVTPPAAVITAPADGATVGGSVAVAVDASDEQGVVRVDVLVDDAVVGSDTTAPFQVLWDTTTSDDGAHTLTALAVDAAGNEGESAAVGVTVDNSCTGDADPPTVTLTAPVAGLVSGVVTLSAAADDDVGVTQVLFFADGDLIGSDASAPFGVDWNSAAVADGPVSLTARASDACGNETISAAVPVEVDNTALSVTSIDPAEGAILAALPAAIDVVFDEAVDETTVDAASFTLVRSGGDGVFGNGNDVAIAGPISANGSDASMDLSGVANEEDSYRVTLADTITDLAGNALDGDDDGQPGGDFVADFSVNIVTYTDDAQPIYFEKCDPCHTGDSNGNHDIGINYEDALNPAEIYPQCTSQGLLVGECTIVLIQLGEMPLGAGCTGDPAQDIGNADCLTQEEQDTIQAWIDAGMPE